MSATPGDEFRGKTVEEAIETGLAALGLKANAVDIEVLSRGSRGLLGFGAEDARVRITLKPAPATPAVQPAKPSRKPVARVADEVPPPAAEPVVPAAPVVVEAPVVAEASVAQPPNTPVEVDPVSLVACELLQGMLDRMDLKAVAEIVPYRGVLDDEQDAPIVLNIEGDDLGILIGRRAETLSALQYLTRLMVNHRTHHWVNLVVDVESYKARREEQLVRLAERMAERAVSTGRVVMLEAMPARERRIVHITLRNYAGVTTESVGDGDHRKVTIIPSA
ncbi:MAG: RNA-binding cell elongation regulator Jag/EloR [Caldilineales bacterium]